MIAAWVLLSCGGGGDPALIAQRDAIQQWRDGVALLEAGDASAAQQRFAAARERRPNDALLLAWEARAVAETGDLDGAIARLKQAVDSSPGLVEAHYNLAVYQVRAGRPEAAAPYLRAALAHDVLDPREVLSDPDFEAVLGHPAFAFLPESSLEARLVAAPGPVFVGSQTTFRLEVLGAHDALDVHGGAVGPAVLVAAVEDVAGQGNQQIRSVDWTLVAQGAGRVEVGPLRVRSGAADAVSEVAGVDVRAPADHVMPQHEGAAPLLVPTALAEGMTIPDATGGAGEVRVRTRPADRVEWEAGTARAQRFTYRENGQPVWLVHRWVGVSPGSHAIRVRQASGGVFSAEVTVEAPVEPPG